MIKAKHLMYHTPDIHLQPWNSYSSPYSYTMSRIIQCHNVQAYKGRLSCEYNGEPLVMNKIM